MTRSFRWKRIYILRGGINYVRWVSGTFDVVNIHDKTELTWLRFYISFARMCPKRKPWISLSKTSHVDFNTQMSIRIDMKLISNSMFSNLKFRWSNKPAVSFHKKRTIWYSIFCARANVRVQLNCANTNMMRSTTEIRNTFRNCNIIR